MHAGAWRRGGSFAALSARARRLEGVLGEEHPDTLTSVNNLAGCMEALGDVAGALPCTGARSTAASACSARSIPTRSPARSCRVRYALGNAAAPCRSSGAPPTVRAHARPGSSLEQNGPGQLRATQTLARGDTERASAPASRQPNQEPAAGRAVVAAAARATVSTAVSRAECG